ncbi:MAG TPA: carbohydrate ABC transporter permease [Mobilitalea sp.]|nr:carbohydrate ABC transporter permease [Mobilitalea sp.]
MDRKRKKRFGKIAIVMVLLFIAFVSLFPMLYTLAGSFRTNVEIFKYALPFSIRTILPVEWTFENYYLLFTKYKFWQPILNTLILICILLPSGILINSVAAFAFSSFEFKFKKQLYVFFILSFMIPGNALTMPLYRLISDLKLMDTRAAMVLPGIASGFLLFLFVQFFKDIPASLIEAARVDGAKWRTVYSKIILPLSKPVVITAGLMLFMGEWNSYLWPLLVARSKDIQTIQMALSDFSTQYTTSWSLILAGAMVSAVIPIFMFLPLQKYFVQGIASTGVKG